MRRRSYLLLGLLVLASTTEARTWHVPTDAPTIQAGIDSAQAGDEVLVAPGTYLEHTIEVREAIWVHSEDGAASTVVDAERLGPLFYVQNVAGPCTLEGFTIRRGYNDDGTGGGGITCIASPLTVRDCVVESCEADFGGGIYVRDADVVVDGCRVQDNEAFGGGGITVFRLNASGSLMATRSQFIGNLATWGIGGGIGSTEAVTIRDCVFAGNRTQAFDGPSALSLSDAEIVGCTFVSNRSWAGGGPAVGSSGLGVVRIERCVVAFNYGPGIDIPFPGSTVSCSAIYANSAGPGEWAEDGGGNFFADPLFCDPEGDDYTLLDDSPCLPGHHPDGADCGLIGALGVGCGVTPTLDTSWGRIKSRYR